MKIAWKLLSGFVSLLILVAGGGYFWMQTAYPNVSDAPDITVEITAKRIARGEYLAWNVSSCIECHSTRDFTRFAGPVKHEGIGAGGERFGEEMGLPGDFYAPNITPFALKEWTDGELYRAITAGVSRDGRPLFPIMPYPNYSRMDKEDIYSIIAYLRTLAPVESTVPTSKANFPMNLIMRTIPADARHEKRPSPESRLPYGRYVVTAAACADCHTMREKGEPLPGMEYAGGFEFTLPVGVVRSANITPDSETGIGSWTEEMFIQRFRMYADSVFTEPVLGPTDFNTPMPWRLYANMTDEDLRAIYAYLQSIKPVKHLVERFTPPQ
ncbi:MAG: cytochrome c [Bacteroidetes bacterium]|nr:cytochrome c [Bacteroidota bacterium]